MLDLTYQQEEGKNPVQNIFKLLVWADGNNAMLGLQNTWWRIWIWLLVFDGIFKLLLKVGHKCLPELEEDSLGTPAVF